MPIVDVVREFNSVKHDALKVCDLFEETALEDRTVLNELVKQAFGIDIPSLYYRETRCYAPLNFDFDSSIPNRFDDGDEIIRSDGQIFDKDILVYSAVRTNVDYNHCLQRVQSLTIDTSHYVGVISDDEYHTNNEIENLRAIEEPEMLIDHSEPILESDTIQGSQVAQIENSPNRIEIIGGQNEETSCCEVQPTELPVAPLSPSYHPSEVEIFEKIQDKHKRRRDNAVLENEQHIITPVIEKPSCTAINYHFQRYHR